MVAEVESAAGRRAGGAVSTERDAQMASIEPLAPCRPSPCWLVRVGKSTLENRLVGHDHSADEAVRESDQKGRHTTTTGS